MRNIEKYCGLLPAFYACYDDNGEVSTERCKAYTEYFVKVGVKGLYVGGSSGECIYQSVAERKKTLEAVMSVAKGKITIIAHVACNNTKDSMELAAHAESLGVDAVASIPPIYFKLPDHAIAAYWNAISSAAPNTDFIIYNIPQLAGVALNNSLFKEMLKNPRVIGVKNSSLATMDIQIWKSIGGEDCVVFNGPDEQYVSGMAIGADGGIGGTYGVMPELFLKAEKAIRGGEMAKAKKMQNDINEIIFLMCSGKSSMQAMTKEILRIRCKLDIGDVRAPLFPMQNDEKAIAEKCARLITDAIARY